MPQKIKPPKKPWTYKSLLAWSRQVDPGRWGLGVELGPGVLTRDYAVGGHPTALRLITPAGYLDIIWGPRELLIPLINFRIGEPPPGGLRFLQSSFGVSLLRRSVAGQSAWRVSRLGAKHAYQLPINVSWLLLPNDRRRGPRYATFDEAGAHNFGSLFFAETWAAWVDNVQRQQAQLREEEKAQRQKQAQAARYIDWIKSQDLVHQAIQLVAPKTTPASAERRRHLGKLS